MLMKQVYIAQKNWEWFFALGVVQVVAGMLAVGFASAALFASAVAIGVLLIAAGAQIAAALLTRDWGGLLLFLLLGVAYTAVGFLTLHSPLLATPGLIFILAPAYLVGGIARIILASVVDISNEIEPKDSAILAWIDADNPGMVAHQFRGLGGTFLRTTLTIEQSAKIKAALHTST
jgi:uncharacterized membrane protein